MNEKYSCQIISSSRELSKREKVKYKDFSQFIALPELLKTAPDFCFEPDLDCVLSIHNEYLTGEKKSTDYEIYLFVDKDGNGFYTGSSSFYDSYRDIVSDMQNESDYQIGVITKPSKNYSGSFYKAVLI